MLSLNILLLALGAVADTCQNIAGMYYCAETKLVQFENVGFSGSYNRVTSFNADGTCSSEPFAFSGSLAPFDEELSVHFRGPIQLEHFKVFTKSGSAAPAAGGKRAIQHLHHRHAAPEPVIVTQTNYFTAYVTAGAEPAAESAAAAAPAETPSAAPAAAAAQNVAQTAAQQPAVAHTTVYVTANANANAAAEPASSSSAAPAAAAPAPAATSAASVETSPESVPAAAAPATSSSSTTTEAPVYNYNYNHLDQTSQTGPSIITRTTSPELPATTSAAPPTSGGGSWSPAASYDAAASSANGLVFLNNLGGSGSGVFDFTFGNSLSYAGADGVSAAASPQVLSRTTVGSNKEFAIFSGSPCEGDSCGYYRPGNVAYHGFGGSHKVFVFEFSMPSDGATGFNGDMPAVWLLNAQIPRNLQYGARSCSCWATGCGELDLWEILSSGNTRLTTTLHDKQGGAGGGTADWFQRPTTGTLKGAAIFTGTTVTVVEIPEIPSSLDDATIESWIAQAGAVSRVSL